MELRTFKGHDIVPIRLRRAQIDIEDIAHALSHLCRFGGHTPAFYSVAQHSVIVSENCPDEPLAGLLHDSAEAYIGDIARPIKRYLSEIRIIEDSISSRICAKFGLEFDAFESEQVIVTDNRALNTEFRDLMHGARKELPLPFDFSIEPVPPESARQMFLNRFKELR